MTGRIAMARPTGEEEIHFQAFERAFVSRFIASNNESSVITYINNDWKNCSVRPEFQSVLSD